MTAGIPAGEPATRMAAARRLLGRPLRVGGIDYLNSRPLLEGLPAALGSEGELVNCVPSELARRLRAGSLDAALVPVVEYLSGPADYRIVSGVSISSYGAVESIRFYHRAPLGALERVGLDRSSLTSALLARLLLAERWAPGRPAPVFIPLSPEEGLRALQEREPELDAVLLIGDAALATPAPAGWEPADLGTEWTRWTGLPFVYAFWVYRGPPLPGLAGLFREARDLGRARIDAIVERGPLPGAMSPREGRRYLLERIQYGLGPAEIEGLLAFRDRARARGLLGSEPAAELRFLPADPVEGGGR
jgi:chorismate dehydratase